MAHWHRLAPGTGQDEANGRSITPAMREFLDGLAELIADLITEDGQGAGASGDDLTPTSRKGAEGR